ncbi:Glycosyltransferase [Mycobacteroides abscessus]|nr:Glycosyltransferase [Mycobacteroides abscessus]
MAGVCRGAGWLASRLRRGGPLRAGVPTLILSTDLDQTLWGRRIKELKVGTTRRFSSTTEKTLASDLRAILDPQCAARARELASRMTKPAESVTKTADLVEGLAASYRCGSRA